jgi:conjugative relaxase-like TrwC/TraI family protein
MLTISKPLNAGQAQSYHAREFTSPEQNYWSRGQNVQSEWQGKLAERYGLAGNVGAAEFAHLSDGQHPGTGDQLVRHRQSHEYQTTDGKTVTSVEHRAGWDATLSAPKSVSLTALVGRDDRVRDAHREAVRVALNELERYTQARIGGNNPPETTGKFIVAKFEHDTARPVDGYAAPQLHTHTVIFNVTERENGQTRALQERGLFQSQQFATAVYQSELMYRLSRLGYELQPGRSGAPEIKGYTQEYLDASSPRSQQIREYLEKAGHNSKEAAEIAAHSTRDRKEILTPREVFAAHRRLAADFGNQADVVVRAAHERAQHLAAPRNAMQLAHEAVTFSRDKNFEREAVVDERALMRDALRRGMGELTYGQVRASFQVRQESGEFVAVGRRPAHLPGQQLTTVGTIAAEQEIVRRMREGMNQVEPVMSRQAAIMVADERGHLNRGQKAVVEEALNSRDQIQGIQGVAGGGKTTALDVIRGAAEVQGYQVAGFAPTSRAAKQLEDAGIHAGTLQGFLARGRDPASDVAEKRFFLVDESSLASTNQMREFLERLGPQDRVLLIGDTRQHQGVEAGRPFQQLQEAGMSTARLEEIVRQKDPALKSVVELLSQGQTTAAIESLQRQGRVTEIPNPEERIRAIAKSCAEHPENTLIVSPDNASRRELNQAVRLELKCAGAVALEDHGLRVLIPRQDMTGAERAWANRYQVEDVVRYSRGSKLAGIEAGSYATVVAMNPADNLLTVRKSSGEQTIYDPKRLSGVSVYRELECEFSVGERIQFTAPDKALGVANRDLARIEAISPDGQVSARLDNGRLVEFNAAEHRHFDHGYAVTSHSAQGLTAERVLIHADTSVHPDLLNTRFGYVSVSRASHEAMLFTNDIAKLSSQLGTDVSKTSAMEIAPTPSISQGVEMSIS